jgi:hypothetical protein
MQMTNAQLNDLIDTLHGFSRPMIEFEMRDDYSGRGMYGKACLGFTTDSPLALHGAICAILAEQERDADNDGEIYEGICWYELSPATDSMGLSSILYYPNVQIAE